MFSLASSLCVPFDCVWYFFLTFAFASIFFVFLFCFFFKFISETSTFLFLSVLPNEATGMLLGKCWFTPVQRWVRTHGMHAPSMLHGLPWLCMLQKVERIYAWKIWSGCWYGCYGQCCWCCTHDRNDPLIKIWLSFCCWKNILYVPKKKIYLQVKQIRLQVQSTHSPFLASGG